MSSDEDDDYMSERFLCQVASKQDIRPGLVKNRAKQREIEIDAKKAKVQREQKAAASKNDPKIRLQEGLNNAITSDNKGFALLAKMGYKQGQALGKTSHGIIEPIALNIKSDRSGLGRERALKELHEQKQIIRHKRLLARSNTHEISTEEFRKRMIQKVEEKAIESALGKCQRTCERLDRCLDIETPAVSWFWPEVKPLIENESDNDASELDIEEDLYEPFEKLEMIANYLRTTYNYCHWCGIQYNNEADIKENCPGLGKDDH